MGELLDRYEREITPSKRSNDRERLKLRVIRRHDLCAIPAKDIGGESVVRYRDERLKTVKPATVKRELAIIRHCFEIARSEWGVLIDQNPAHRIRLPNADQPRSRRLTSEEYETLDRAVGISNAWNLKHIVGLALETGMRRGELLSLMFANVDLMKRTALLPMTKNGDSRKVSLTKSAVKILSSIPNKPKLFPITNHALRQSFQTALKKAGIKDFRFHDLRHEAISRFFEMGLSIPEVALISGHRDTKMLMRYTHLRAEDIAIKLSKI